jgi:hypothetical protein
MSQHKLICPTCFKNGTADVFRNGGNPMAILFQCGHSVHEKT